MAENTSEQYLRTCSLIVYGSDFTGLDLSNLRIKFAIKRSDTLTPNMADIRVYNVEPETALSMLMVLTPTPGIISQPRGQVILQAGYPGNTGVIFKGNIKQIILGRESATDTFVDIIAGDGDRAFNYSIVNTTIAAGATQEQQINAATAEMAKKGVTLGHVGDVKPNQLPRGKVMYGNARNYLTSAGQNTNKTWSIQDEKITFVPVTSYLPGEVVQLTSKTGLIGTPNQTSEGINVRCLLNPRIQVGGRISIAEATVQELKINLSVPGSAANIPAALTADGIYYVMVAEHTGDTRGIDWYTTMVCFALNVTTNPLNAGRVGFGS